MFLSLTPGASPQTRAALARMIATFIFFLLLGASLKDGGKESWLLTGAAEPLAPWKPLGR